MKLPREYVCAELNVARTSIKKFMAEYGIYATDGWVYCDYEKLDKIKFDISLWGGCALGWVKIPKGLTARFKLHAKNGTRDCFINMNNGTKQNLYSFEPELLTEDELKTRMEDRERAKIRPKK